MGVLDILTTVLDADETVAGLAILSSLVVTVSVLSYKLFFDVKEPEEPATLPAMPSSKDIQDNADNYLSGLLSAVAVGLAGICVLAAGSELYGPSDVPSAGLVSESAGSYALFSKSDVGFTLGSGTNLDMFAEALLDEELPEPVL